MGKELWNLRLYSKDYDTDSENEILPWTPVVVNDIPDLSNTYEDPDDDPRSMTIYLYWNAHFEQEKYQQFERWVAESLSSDVTKNFKRKKLKHCSAEMTYRNETRHLSYVYLEEIHYTPLDYIDIGTREVKAIIDYRTMSSEPIRITSTNELPQED